MKDFETLMQDHFGQLNTQELQILYSNFHEEKLNRNDFFTKSDNICDRLSIVKSGILRVYALSDRKEITQWISTKDFLITEVRGFFFDQPNRWTIQAFTDTALLTISKTNYRKLCKDLPKWNEIEKQFIVKCFAMIEDRVFSHLSMSAEERYDLYFEQNRDLFNQVPLQYIASVLGMTPETFSRIRNRRVENS
jgi:CRP/FNR family transcriptional regulator, anaerobic regulatory protein